MKKTFAIHPKYLPVSPVRLVYAIAVAWLVMDRLNASDFWRGFVWTFYAILAIAGISEFVKQQWCKPHLTAIEKEEEE